MCRSQGTHWIGCGFVARDQEGLAAAATKVQGTPVAASARFRHPVFSPKSAERPGVFPNPRQRFFSYIFELHSGNNGSGVAGQDAPRRVEQHELEARASMARFGKAD